MKSWNVGTTYALRPEVVISAVPDGPLSVGLRYPSSPSSSSGSTSFACVDFLDVLEYRWISSVHTYFPDGCDVNEADLIEIANSARLDLLLDRGGAGDGRMRDFLRNSPLHHYRIGFNGYGTFDFICAGLSVTVE